MRGRAACVAARRIRHAHVPRRGRDAPRSAAAASLRYRHRGAATAFSFELTSAARNAGAARFSSGPLRIGLRRPRSARRPLDWATLGRVRLDVVRGERPPQRRGSLAQPRADAHPARARAARP